ncbi:hypothetical protein STVIR_4714 [Streptomyces viridochromogenes Tue57]|uniref:Uncharacterized protein n=1 Tax=Streptomyces viridochromogenes Tue57 TaxID=1160705 RepID=L8PDS7_STRVR|nr:hypothetical protein STVIR_4714 [Streptomyces viridochromogenes Tue57]
MGVRQAVQVPGFAVDGEKVKAGAGEHQEQTNARS